MKAPQAVARGWQNFRRTFFPLAAASYSNRITRQPLLSEGDISQLVREAYSTPDAALHRPEVQFRHVGDMRSVHLGQGLDFEESRVYQRGDDLRSMDWRTTARTGKAYVKVFREEHQAALHVVVDRGASMRFATRGRLKAAQAARVAVLAAFSAVRKGASVGGSVIQPERVFIPTASGQAGALRLSQAVSAAAPPLDSASASVDLRQTLELLEPILVRGTRLIVISDFHGFENIDIDLIARFIFRHEVVLVLIADPAELALSDIGPAYFSGPDDADGIWLDLHDPALRERFVEQQLATKKHLHALFESMGVQLHTCLTTADRLPQL